MKMRILLMIAGMATSTAAAVLYVNAPAHTMREIPMPAVNMQRRNTAVGVIEGRVVNSQGESVAGAKVSAESDSSGPVRLISSFSDKDGNYKIEVNEPGTYTLTGSKEEGGYPLTISAFHFYGTDIVAPKIEVNTNQVIENVNINLGDKASILEGTIIDSKTNLPVSGKTTITLRRLDDPSLLYRIGGAEEKKNGKFKALVPNVPFTIEISSPDYDTWMYSRDGKGNGSDALILDPGETKKLTITMRLKQPSQ
jgi:hypothetical protein